MRAALDVRTVGYEHDAARLRITALLAQIDLAQARDDLRAVRLLTAPLRDAQARYRATSAVLAAAAADTRPLAGVR